MQLLVLQLLVLAAVTLAQLPPLPTIDKCPFRHNVTDAMSLPQHKYAVLEDCLFYFLTDKAEKAQGKTGALSMLPPSRYDKKTDRIEITVREASLRQLWMVGRWNEVWKEMHINGYMKLSWDDWRLTWQKDGPPPDKGWKIDSLKVRSPSHLWTPDLNSERYQTSVQAGDFTIYKDLTMYSTGNVSAILEFRMQAKCDIDYHNYPADRQYCCFSLSSANFEEMIRFNVPKDETKSVNIDKLQTNWEIEGTSLVKEQNDDNPNAQYMRLCVQASRKSSTLAIELTVPMLVSAVLVLISPIVGPFNHQCYVKLFAILLQFICFQFLVSKTPQIGFGTSNRVPTIYKFYEFTLVLTLVSLCLTLFLWCLSRIERKLPAPHSVKLFANTVNSKLCCILDKRADVEAGQKELDNDWACIYVAINNVVSFIIILTYVLGCIILSCV